MPRATPKQRKRGAAAPSGATWLTRPRPPRRPKNMPDVLWFLKWAALFCVLALRSYSDGPVPFKDLVPLREAATKSALVLTAHPDDEAMFFAPTVMALVDQGWDVAGLCLSTGSADGLGGVRKKELYKSYERLGVKSDNVFVMDDPRFQDDIKQTWDTEQVSKLLQDHLSARPASLLITFDRTGISQHPNHISLSLATEHYRTHHNSSNAPLIFTLASPSTVQKFTGPSTAVLHIFRSNLARLAWWTPPPPSSDRITIVSGGKKWVGGVMAMLEHRSQLVWFRWLYLAFSRLMWVNELVAVR